MDNVIKLDDRRFETESEKQFTSLISEDMEKGHGVEKMPASIFDRVNAIRAKAKANEALSGLQVEAETELLEG